MLPFQAHADGPTAGASRRRSSLTMREGAGASAVLARGYLRGGAVKPAPSRRLHTRLSRMPNYKRFLLQSQTQSAAYGPGRIADGAVGGFSQMGGMTLFTGRRCEPP